VQRWVQPACFFMIFQFYVYLKPVTFFTWFERVDHIHERPVAVELRLEADPLLGFVFRRNVFSFRRNIAAFRRFVLRRFVDARRIGGVSR